MSGGARRADVLIGDPGWLLHRIDPAGNRAVFVPTDRAALRDAAFLDGRTDFASGSAVEIPLTALIDAGRHLDTGPQRHLFHMSFCGSTLLARLLDCPGKSLALREPQCLVDLADWRAALQRSGQPDPRYGDALRAANALLARRWEADEVVLVKPSNWVNNLLQEPAHGAVTHTLHLTIGLRPFIHAVFRGGRDRIAFTARVAAHLASVFDDGQALIARAVNASSDPMARAANLVALAHLLQVRLFSTRAGATLDFADVTGDPADALARAAAALALDLTDEERAAAVDRHAARDSKRADAAFSTTRRADDDAEVERHHGPLIDAAVRWALS